MKDTWERQQIDPNYEFDTPVPTPIKQKQTDVNSLASSIGDLAPKALAT